MSHLITVALLATTLALSLSGCSGPHKHQSNNAIYYWKTYVNFSHQDSVFLRHHDVSRIYLRYFDIRENREHSAVPDALAWLHHGDIPSGTDVIPTVFITLDAMKGMTGREGEFALKIHDYIKAMNASAGITNIPEIQLDCDWTPSTQESYFRLCDELHSRLAEDNVKLSSTIRLHQLSLPAPPVDRGVLMVYNVGELKSPEETNSILRLDVVKKYLDRSPRYPLHLDVAYPVFSWGAVFRNGTFNRLARIENDIDSIGTLRNIKDNWYEITTRNDDPLNMSYHEQMRYETPSFKDIMTVKKLVEKYLGYKPENTILFHLDQKQLSRYSPEEIALIYE